MPVERADVVVVGSGPAGSTTAALLATRGARVIALDTATFPRRKACAEYVSPGGVELLQQLGALARLMGRGRHLRGMEIIAPSGACHLVQYGGARGLSVAREHLDQALQEVASTRGAEMRQGCRVLDVVRDGQRVVGVRLADGNEVRADLVVGADGLHSIVARAAGQPVPVRWPRRLGLVAHLAGAPWAEDTGQLWVGQRGYVGVAPLDNHGLLTVGVVQAMPRGHAPAAQLFESGVAEFGSLAQRLAPARFAESIMGVGPLARRVRASAGPGWLLVGDAAGFFDPFTGEGIFRALRSAQLAAQHPESPIAYRQARARAFGAKEKLTVIIQLFVQRPRLLELAIRRLNERPRVAEELGLMLGDLRPASLDVVWRLLGP